MLILFDHGTPKGLASALPGQTVITAQSRGWDRLINGALLNAAEEAAFDLLRATLSEPPLSIMHDVEGNCETRTYHKLGTLFFAGKNRSGVAMKQLPPENVERTLVPNSAFEKAFDMLCKIAREQK